MMTLVVALSICGLAIAQDAPTAEDIMNKYLTAIGGKEFLASVTDLTAEMSTEMQGNTMLMIRKHKTPNKFLVVGNARGMEVFKMVSDGSKVFQGSMRGNQTVIEGKDAQLLITQNMLFPELHFADVGIKSIVNGTEKIDRKDAYKITHTASDGSFSWSDFYDIESNLKVQTVSSMKTPQGEFQQTVMYGNYKDFKGLKYPTTISQGNSQFQMQLSVDKVKINDGLTDAGFAISQ